MMLHAASNQFKRVAQGDTVWIITCQGDRFFLLGPITIAKRLGLLAAQEYLGRDNLYQAKYHIVPHPNRIERMKNIDITESLQHLRFDGTPRDRLPAKPTPQYLQSMRQLSSESAGLLRKLYDSKKA
jgi:hypothetical protein